MKAEGVAAKKLADMQIAKGELAKKEIDLEYQRTLRTLRADNQRLLDTRARGSFIPAIRASSRGAEIACFNRPELERAIQHFDAGVSKLLDEGDANAIGLDAARAWANKFSQ